MTRPTGCTCSKSARRWLDDGTCQTCSQNVLEEQLTPVILLVLCGCTGIVLHRNARGYDSHFPDGTRRKAPIRYGVGDGGADYLGPCGIPGLYYGKYLAVEMKTPMGRLQPNQRNFGCLISRLGGVYAVVRSEQHAHELLAYLRGSTPRPAFVFAPQEKT